MASGADAVGRWSVIALGLSMPISVALDNALLAIIAVAWLAAANYRQKLALIRVNPVAVAAFGLFALLALGLTYGARNPGDGLRYIGKYADLLFVPVLLTSFRDQRTRELGLTVFCGAMILSLIVSHLGYQDLLVNNPLLPRSYEFPAGFKLSITHSLLMCYAAFVFTLLARELTRRSLRIICIIIALLSIHNVLFIVISRTGYLVLAALLLYFFTVTCGRRGVLIAAVLGMTLFGGAYVGSDRFYLRVNEAAQEMSDWQPGKPSDTSVGLRMEFYRDTFAIVREHPVFGAGTGSFPAAYAAVVSGKHMIETANPHNEYLLIASQIGLIGLASLLYLFYRQWRYAGELVQPLFRDLARGLVLTFIIGCLFNSLLLDHTEGLLFAWMSALVFAAPARRQQAVEHAP